MLIINIVSTIYFITFFKIYYKTKKELDKNAKSTHNRSDYR